MSYKAITRAKAYKIGFGTDAPGTLVDYNKLANYTDLNQLQCTIKENGVHTLLEYSTPNIRGEYRTLVEDDVIAAGYVLTYVMNGHGTQIPPTRTQTMPNPLPIPTAEEGADVRHGGWFLNEELTAKAVAGTKLTEDTTIYAKWISNSLSFRLASATDTSIIDIDNISAITLNNITYTGEELTSHYNTETKTYTFSNFTAETVNYSIINTASSDFKDLLNVEQPFESLNRKRILLYPKVATLGDINVSCNWTKVTGGDSRIFDVYTLVYDGEAPNPNETTNSNKILEVSYSGHNKDFYRPTGATQYDFMLNYDTDLSKTGADWNPGETSKITLSSGMTSIEQLLRTYTFVFIANDYESGKPNTSNPSSNFANMCPDMTWTIKIGDYVKTISLNVPVGSTGETGDVSANWVAFKTKLLGGEEEIQSDLSNVIVEFSRDGYAYFDGTNSAKTTTYDLTNGGRDTVS